MSISDKKLKCRADMEHGQSNSSASPKSELHGRKIERPRECVSLYNYNPVYQEWQLDMCSTLGLCFAGSKRVTPGGPYVPMRPPDPCTIRCTTGDGNCLFQSFSYIVTGSEDQHQAVHLIIVCHMTTIVGGCPGLPRTVLGVFACS